jgi:hypothetical protein
MVLGYLDAGSASIGASVIAAGVAGAGVMARSAMGRFKRGKKTDAPVDEETEAVETDVAIDADVDADS